MTLLHRAARLLLSTNRPSCLFAALFQVSRPGRAGDRRGESRSLFAASLLAFFGCAHPAPVPLAEGGLAHRPALASELADTGGLRERLPARDDADLVILYGGEQMGSLETCGCPKRPRGSLARVQGYREALRKARPGTPDLLLNAGNWLDDTIGTDDKLRLDVDISDAWMIRGLEAGGWDALNVGFRDLPWLAENGFPAAAVSASVRPEGEAARGPAPWRVLEAGDLRVAVTGVSPEGMTFLQPAGWRYHDEIAALREVIPRMEAEADLVVVLAYGVGPRAQELARVPGIDVIVEAGEFHERYEPFHEGEAVWVRSHTQTMRLGELRLVIRDGKVLGAIDRKIDLDAAIPAEPGLLSMQKQAREEIDRAQKALFGSP